MITLGIIGVVAAMVIPTLISNINVARFKTQSRKAIATLNQAVKMSVAQYDFDFAGASEVSDLTKLDPKTNTSIASMLAGTLSGATITDSIKKADGTSYDVRKVSSALQKYSFLYVKLADGSIFAFNKDAKDCAISTIDKKDFEYIREAMDKGCVGVIDYNGTALPNMELYCDNPPNTESGHTLWGCQVKNNAKKSDSIPVVFYNQVVEPLYNAGYFFITDDKFK